MLLLCIKRRLNYSLRGVYVWVDGCQALRPGETTVHSWWEHQGNQGRDDHSRIFLSSNVNWAKLSHYRQFNLLLYHMSYCHLFNKPFENRSQVHFKMEGIAILFLWLINTGESIYMPSNVSNLVHEAYTLKQLLSSTMPDVWTNFIPSEINMSSSVLTWPQELTLWTFYTRVHQWKFSLW